MSVESMDGLSLGQDTEYADQYSPALLFPIPRETTREALGLDEQNLPFKGCDIWNAYEVSWLNARGLPQVACAEFSFPCDSHAIIESKSFKLYLNSFNQSVFDSWEQVSSLMAADLAKASGADVAVRFYRADQALADAIGAPEAECLDELDVAIEQYDPEPSLLSSAGQPEKVLLVSHLLRSLCPVTGQPDWGSVYIEYAGPAIDREGLLRYIVGYRRHQEFHEQCVERIYRDITAQCAPDTLSVYARYVRRGGLDINPFRSSERDLVPNWRLFRQ